MVLDLHTLVILQRSKINASCLEMFFKSDKCALLRYILATNHEGNTDWYDLFRCTPTTKTTVCEWRTLFCPWLTGGNVKMFDLLCILIADGWNCRKVAKKKTKVDILAGVTGTPSPSLWLRFCSSIVSMIFSSFHGSLLPRRHQHNHGNEYWRVKSTCLVQQ